MCRLVKFFNLIYPIYQQFKRKYIDSDLYAHLTISGQNVNDIEYIFYSFLRYVPGELIFPKDETHPFKLFLVMIKVIKNYDLKLYTPYMHELLVSAVKEGLSGDNLRNYLIVNLQMGIIANNGDTTSALELLQKSLVQLLDSQGELPLIDKDQVKVCYQSYLSFKEEHVSLLLEIPENENEITDSEIIDESLSFSDVDSSSESSSMNMNMNELLYSQITDLDMSSVGSLQPSSSAVMELAKVWTKHINKFEDFIADKDLWIEVYTSDQNALGYDDTNLLHQLISDFGGVVNQKFLKNHISLVFAQMLGLMPKLKLVAFKYNYRNCIKDSDSNSYKKPSLCPFKVCHKLISDFYEKYDILDSTQFAHINELANKEKEVDIPYLDDFSKAECINAFNKYKAEIV